MSLANERLRELCLRLYALANDFPGLAERAAKEELSYSDFLETGLRLEQQVRQIRSSTLLTRIAGFPAIETLDNYDFAFARNRCCEQSGCRSCSSSMRSAVRPSGARRPTVGTQRAMPVPPSSSGMASSSISPSAARTGRAASRTVFCAVPLWVPR